MDTKEFEKKMADNLCPFCGNKLEYYDGAIGYEAMKCPDKKVCGFVTDHSGHHIERE